MRCFILLGFIFISQVCIAFAPIEEQLPPNHEPTGDGSDVNNICPCEYNLGTAAFATDDPLNWYFVNPPPYPATTPFSLNRNVGFTQGNISLTTDGLEVNKPRNYWISFSAVVLNPDVMNTPGIGVSIVRDGVYIPLDPTLPPGGVAVLPPNSPVTITGSGVLPNVATGTDLSLVAFSTAGVMADVAVISWSISITRIGDS